MAGLEVACKNHKAAEQYLHKMLHLDPANIYAIIVHLCSL